MCRVGQFVVLVLTISLAIACDQTAALPSSGMATNNSAPTYTRYPTYTPFPTYTPYSTYTPCPTYTLHSASVDAETLVWPKGSRDDVILWTDAAEFVGTEMIVEGTVVRTHNSGNAVFLNFAEEFQGTFNVVVFQEDWHKFPTPPETLFYGRRIRAQGLIAEYQGAPEIVVRDLWQIETALALGQEEVLCECSTPVATQVVVTATAVSREVLASASEQTDRAAGATEPSPRIEVVNWQDAAAFDGKTVTVEGRVIATYNSGKVVFLNFDEDYRNTFKVVIFPEAWPMFPQPPEDMYEGQLVQVMGQVKMYQGAPEIIVETPDAIRILE